MNFSGRNKVRGYEQVGDVLCSFLEENKKNAEVCFIFLQEIFFGKIEFNIFYNDKIYNYSFKSCYEIFLELLKDNNPICFDVLSPQYLPLREKIDVNPEVRKYGSFYDFSFGCVVGKNQWEFHLNHDKFSPYNFLNLKNLPSIVNRGLIVDESFLSDIDSVAYLNYDKNAESNVRFEALFEIEELYFQSHGVTRGDMLYLDIDHDTTLSELESCRKEIQYIKIGFIEHNNNVFMMSNNDTFSYDKRFFVYFEKINKILNNHRLGVGSFSYFFYIFMASCGIKIKYKDLNKYIYEDCEEYGEYFLDGIFTLNSFLFTKIRCNILDSIVRGSNCLKSYGVFKFLQCLYIKKSDIENFKYRHKENKYNLSDNNIYSCIVKNKTGNKDIFPRDKTIEDVVFHLTRKIEDIGVVYCRAALAIHFNKNKTKNEILKLFFENEYKNNSQSDEKITQNIQRKMSSYFSKNL